MSVTDMFKSENRDTKYVLNKLRGYDNSGDLMKMVVVAVVRTPDGRGAEMLIGSDGVDRYDLLSAAQQCRLSADAMYRLMVAAGMEYEEEHGTDGTAH